jgi:hypothetical protein
MNPPAANMLCVVALLSSSCARTSEPIGVHTHKRNDAPTSDAGQAGAADATGFDPDAFLTQTTFEMPGDGEPNDNAFVGPYCCTGSTGTVRSAAGYSVGYFHFYFWDGQAYNLSDHDSAVPTLVLDVSGSSNVLNPRAKLVNEVVRIEPSVASIGALQTASVGDLTFDVTLRQAQLTADGAYFVSSSLVVDYAVKLTDSAHQRVASGTPEAVFGTGECQPTANNQAWSCDFPRAHGPDCVVTLPSPLSNPSCTEIGLAVTYNDGWNSNYEVLPEGVDCSLHENDPLVDRATGIVRLCGLCDAALSRGESVTLRGNSGMCE